MNEKNELRFLAGYPPHLLEQVQTLIDQNALQTWLQKRYPEAHNNRHSIQTDKALYERVSELKQQYLKNAPPLAKVTYDSKLDLIKGTLGSNTFASRVQGGKLKRKNEIRIAALLREAPLEFLDMLIVHELAHLKEKDHNKAFYQLCQHMLSNYALLEFELRVWLTGRSLGLPSP